MDIQTIAPQRVSLVQAFKRCQDASDAFFENHTDEFRPIGNAYRQYIQACKDIGEGYFSLYAIQTGKGIPEDYPELPLETGALPRLDGGMYWVGPYRA